MNHYEQLAIGIFERRMGFEFTDECRESREWSAALEAARWVSEP